MTHQPKMRNKQIATVRRGSRVLVGVVSLAMAATMCSLDTASAVSGPVPAAAPKAPAAGALSSGVLSSVASTDEQPAIDPVLVSERSSRFATTVLQADGSYQTTVSLTPVNYLDGSGEWAPIDTTMVEPGSASMQDKWAAKNAAADFTALVPNDAGERPVRVSADGSWVTLQLQGLDGAPQVADSTATYTGGQIGAAGEVSYQTTETGLKETVVLDQAPAPAEATA
ncbi:hypothetical protein ISG29_11520, partial [Nocardioides sp. CBS4Y-1]|nr:hypothetical protein [Nocardioides acrostichi]